MADVKKQLRKRIIALDEKLGELSKLEDYSHVVAKPYPPASEAEIKAYETYLGVPLPPSYRAFLSIHNGYDWLAYPGHMLSIQDLMPKGKWHAAVIEWKQTSARYGAPEVVDGIPIANMGQLNNWVYLDPNQKDADTGEYQVVEWEPDDVAEYDDILAFLDECLETVQYGLDEAAGLIDEEDEDD